MTPVGLDVEPGAEPRTDRLWALRAWALDHPVLAVLVLALALRVVVATVVFVAFDGSLFLDDQTFSQLAEERAGGDSSAWDSQTRLLFRQTATFLVPLTAIYDVFGPVVLLGQLLAAALGTAAAALTARVALDALGARWALIAGVVVAAFPSQVLWSSLTLKDSAVWAVLTGLALAVAMAGKAAGPRLLFWGAAAAVLLVLLGYLRIHTLVVAAWAVALAAWWGGDRNRLVRGAGAVLLAVLIPFAFGKGPAGLGFVTDSTGTLAQRRAANAEGASTAIVPDAGPGQLEEGLEANVEHLPRGVAVMLFEPFPWSSSGNARLLLARIESLLWYPLLGLAVVGLSQLRRHPRVLAFPALAGAGVVVLYALAEGNVGTAYRHRGEFVWAVALLAVFGAARLVQRRAPEEEAPCAR